MLANLTLLFADQQAGGEAIPGWVGTIFGAAGPAAILAWYLWYTTAVINPKREDAAKAEREAMAQRHAEHINTTINNFRNDQNAMWQIQRECTQQMSSAIQSSCRFQHGPPPTGTTG